METGPADGEPVLLLHGEPSWSFLYRKVMPVLADAGLRAIAADLVGFGRSDKPAEIGDHSFAGHVEWIRALAFDHLDLRGLTIVGQDWGGLIGLRLVAEHPDRFARVVAANTGLPTGDQPMPEVWLRFREVVRTTPTLSVSRLVQSGCQTKLSPEVLAAYDAPFPDPDYAAAVRAMPGLVPTSPDDPATEANRAAWRRLAAWDKPFLVAFSDRDPITGAMAPVLKKTVPGAAGLEHPVIEGAGHFLQEDAGERLGAVIADFGDPRQTGRPGGGSACWRRSAPGGAGPGRARHRRRLTMTEDTTGIETDIVTKLSPRSVADTVSKLTGMINAKGMKLFAVIDQSAEARQVGLSLRETTLVTFGSPAAGTPVMAAAPLAALDLPLKVLVWADEGQTKVSYYAPAALVARHHLGPDLAGNLAGINALTDALVAT